MANNETFSIKTTMDLDTYRWEYHVYSNRSGFVITCQTKRQAELLIKMLKEGE